MPTSFQTQLSLRVDQPTYEKIKVAAEQANMAVYRWLQLAVEHELERQEAGS